MNNKIMRKLIKEKYAAIPEKQLSVGVFLKTIGYKYITIINTWGNGKLYKMSIDEFFEIYM